MAAMFDGSPLISIPEFTERRKTRLREVTLQEIVGNLEMLLPRHADDNTIIDIVQTEQELPVIADAVQIGLALMSFINKALESMPTGGRLTLTTGVTKFNGNLIGNNRACAFISISDTGPGMDAGALSKIFEPSSAAGDDGLRGMGIPLAYHTIKQHNGSINPESMPGHGTTVKIYFPLIHRASTQFDVIPLPPAERTESRSRRGISTI